jgi:hypothetical protein
VSASINAKSKAPSRLWLPRQWERIKDGQRESLSERCHTVAASLFAWGGRSAGGGQESFRRESTPLVFSPEGEGAREGDSNFSLLSLDFVLVDFETLILMKTKSCMRFCGYTIVEALNGVVFLVDKHNSVWMNYRPSQYIGSTTSVGSARVLIII